MVSVLKKLNLGIAGLFALAGFVVFTPLVMAQSPLDPACEGAAAQTEYCRNLQAEENRDRILGPEGILTTITQVIVYLVGIVSVIMIIIGGLRYVVSGGDSTGTASAKNTILYALIGLIVALFAQVIVSFVLSKL